MYAIGQPLEPSKEKRQGKNQRKRKDLSIGHRSNALGYFTFIL
jgi:hypothetical protein